MSRTLTIKQEAFVLAYIEIGNASEAYRLVYSTSRMKSATVNRMAFELLENRKITARVEQIQEKHRKRHEVTVDSICTELEAARLQALEAGHSSAAIQASMGKAKLHGLLTDKREIAGKDQGPLIVNSPEELTDEQLIAIIQSTGVEPEIIKRGR